MDEVKVIHSFGIDRRRIAIKQDGEDLQSYPGYWLEGVGSRLDMFNTWIVPRPGATERFLYCELNGERIADQSSFGDAALPTSGIEDKMEANMCNSSLIYDLQGRRMTGTPQRGIYIQNGRIYVK